MLILSKDTKRDYAKFQQHYRLAAEKPKSVGLNGHVLDTHIMSARKYLANSGLELSDDTQTKLEYRRRAAHSKRGRKSGALVLCNDIDYAVFGEFIAEYENLRATLLTSLSMDAAAASVDASKGIGDVAAAPMSCVTRNDSMITLDERNYEQVLGGASADALTYVRGNYRILFDRAHISFPLLRDYIAESAHLERLYAQNAFNAHKHIAYQNHALNLKQLQKIQIALGDLERDLAGMTLQDGVEIKRKKSLGFYYTVGFPKHDGGKAKKQRITIPKLAIGLTDAEDITDVYEPDQPTDDLNPLSRIPIYQVVLGHEYFVYLSLRDIQSNLQSIELGNKIFLARDWYYYARKSNSIPENMDISEVFVWWG